MFGLLSLDKPAGVTSRDVVNDVQRLVRPEKVGHAGTLDPLATGVLVVCVGAATRLVEYLQQPPKRYLGTFLLGRRSDTEDTDGQVEELPDPPQPTAAEVAAVLPRFVGRIVQRPPAYSALKVEGRRAYDLARRGQAVELAPREIVVESLVLVRFAYPELVLDVTCGSGTYVRSLGRDIAESLGTAAVMSALRRLAVGPFDVGSSIPPDHLTRENLASHLLSPALAVAHLPSLRLTAEEIGRLRNGGAIDRRFDRPEPTSGSNEWAGLDEQGRLMALLTPRAGRLWPTKSFVGSAMPSS